MSRKTETVSVTLCAGHAAGLRVLVAQYNAAQGTALTLAQWSQLHLRELAIAAELQRVAAELQAQAQADVNAAIAAARERLLREDVGPRRKQEARSREEEAQA